MDNQTMKHWAQQIDEQQIAHLVFDRQDSSVNTMGKEVLDELAQQLKTIADDQAIKGLIIQSGKKNGFK